MMVRMKILEPNEILGRFPSSTQGRIIIFMTNEFEGFIFFFTLVILMGLELDHC
jgi:hypothetical protein